MSMTRKEALHILQNGSWWDCLPDDMSDADMNPLQDAPEVALEALRPVSREQVEKARGEWIGVPNMGVYDIVCSKCGYSTGIRFWSSDFCPNCGAPMTDEAVDMVMERLEAVKDD